MNNVYYWLSMVLILVACFPNQPRCQANRNTYLSFTVGWQKLDQRLFDFSGAANLVASEDAKGGGQFRISLFGQLIRHDRLGLTGGIGVSREIDPFTRPYSLCYFESPCPYILVYIEKYFKDQVSFPLNFEYALFRGFKPSILLNLQLLPSITFRKKVIDTRGVTLKKYLFEPFSVEVNPGLILDFNRIRFVCSYRVFQVRKVDKLIFNSILYKDPNDTPKKKVECYNPSKVYFELNYLF